MRNKIGRLTPLTQALIAALAMGLMAATGVAASQPDDDQASDRGPLTSEQKLIVNVVDLTGLANIESDFIREDLLQSAFYRAAEDEDWIGKFEFRYNYNVPSDRGGYLEFTIVDWGRSAANMYEATVTASYRNAAGESINLGTFRNQEPGITVTTGWDVTDRFIEAAEGAFDKALDKLAEESGIQS